MNRRNFLKGFCAVTGTLAVAPSIALAPVDVMPVVPDISQMITMIKPTVFPLDTLIAEFKMFRELRDEQIAHLDGTEWSKIIRTGELEIIDLT